jgi:RND superfamily putative drug exporter
MSERLGKLGRMAFERRWWVIGAWIVVLVVLGVLAGKFYKQPSDAISIPGTEAQASLDRFSGLFPDAGKGTGRIVVEVRDGTITDQKDALDKMAERLRSVDGVSQVVDPFKLDGMISKDKRIAFLTISLDKEASAIDKKTISDIEAIATSTRSDALAVEMGGDIINKVPGNILGVGEILGVVIALIVLVITLGSLVAAGLPIIVAIVTVAGGAAGLFALSKVIDITSTTPVLAVMLGLAVGIDYSLFIVNKYRHYLLQGYDYKEAASRAVATAGNAVIFAAVTVVIALSALMVVGIPFMTSMGLAAAAAVALAAIIAVTLLPALFGFAGKKIFSSKTRRMISATQKKGPRESHAVSRNTVWYRVAQYIVKHPIVTLLVAGAVVTVLALPVRSLTLGLPTDEHAAVNTTERKAYEMLKRGFGEGFNAPLIIVVENIVPVSDNDRQEVRTQLTTIFEKRLADETKKQTEAAYQRMATATTEQELQMIQQELTEKQQMAVIQEKAARAELEVQIATYTPLYHLSRISGSIAERKDVDSAMPLLVTDDTTKGIIQVIPSGGPSSESTVALIDDLRNESTVAKLTGDSATTFGVTGSTALELDIDAKLASVLPQYLMIVVGLSFGLLVLVFRSILVPLKATLGFLLSVAAMFGAMVAVFQWGWFGIADATGPIVSFIPIIAIGVLFGLAMDYEFFLVSSMHEEFERTGDAKKAVVNGYALGSRVVVAAGVIMVAVFAGFVTNHDATIQAMGFGLAVGIFVDAFIVRLLIVPVVMSLLGKSAWWLPKWLGKILPNLSIEGSEANTARKK